MIPVYIYIFAFDRNCVENGLHSGSVKISLENYSRLASRTARARRKSTGTKRVQNEHVERSRRSFEIIGPPQTPETYSTRLAAARRLSDPAPIIRRYGFGFVRFPSDFVDIRHAAFESSARVRFVNFACLTTLRVGRPLHPVSDAGTGGHACLPRRDRTEAPDRLKDLSSKTDGTFFNFERPTRVFRVIHMCAEA